MTLATVFTLVNLSVLPAWLLLILAPNWRGTKAIVHSGLYPIVLGVIYIIGLGTAVLGGTGGDSMDFTTLEGVRAVFGSDIGVLVGWTHYLVFDLFVGAWEARDAKRRGFKHWLLIPCLFFTLMAGPAGLVLYLILRRVSGKGGFGLGE